MPSGFIPRHAPEQSPRAAAGPRVTTALRQASLGGRTIPYELVRTRRRSIAIQAVADGIRVRAPQRAAVADIEHFMLTHADWIAAHLAECRRRPAFAWQDGSVLPLLGSPVRITGVDGLPAINRLDNLLNVPSAMLEKGCREAVLAWIKSSAEAVFRDRIAHHAEKMGASPPTLRLSNAKTRWGSCAHGPGGTRISLHWKLYLFPPALIDYVIAHELAHLRQMNHSARFWLEVERLYPDYRAARLELRRAAKTLPPI